LIRENSSFLCLKRVFPDRGFGLMTMKWLKVILCSSLVLGTSAGAAAQADCGYQVFIDVRNEANDSVNNARLELGGWKIFQYTPERTYRASGLLGVGAPALKTNLKVSASGYKTFIHELNISCARYEYLLILRPKRSKLAAELKTIPSTTK
jgi:hypothetical protein